MPAINLADMAKLASSDNDTLKLGVVQTFREVSKVMDMMSFTDIGDLQVKLIRAKSFPTPAFRKIGNAYNSTKGDFELVEERVYALGGNLDTDKTIERAKGILGARAAHEKLQLEAITRMFNHYLINGDPTSDPDGFTGLWYRLVNDLPSTQSIDANLDISPTTASTTWKTDIINALDQLIDACNEGDCDALLMDRSTRLRLQAAFKGSGLLATTTDQLNRKFLTYGEGGPMLINMGYQRDETSTSAGTKIIGHAENVGGTALTGGARTSIYAVKFGKDKFNGIQEYGLEVTDKGELDDGVTYRTVVDWPVGMYVAHPRSVARLYDIKAV